MIAQAFEDYLVKQEGAFLTPAANLAVLVDSHNRNHFSDGYHGLSDAA